MLALSFSAAMLGIDGYIVRIEADSSPGTPSFTLIGLPDRALGESRERVRAAIFNSGFAFPPGKLLVNLSPADVRKEGRGFDLPLALALLAIDEHVKRADLQRFVALGELALDGGVRAISGILPMVIAARGAGISELIVPRANAAEATLVRDVAIYAVDSLREAVAVVLGHGSKFRVPRERPERAPPENSNGVIDDFADVRGQHEAKRALEIAAAGGHNVLLLGPPGCGKTMLARRLPSILPPMNDDEALEVTSVMSAAGLLGTQPRLVRERPFRAPHHTATRQALAGGGTIPRPGEISLAHRGVLFLDEFGEFDRATIEVMRQPMEEGAIAVTRTAGTFRFPARFMLIVATNPCPCGYRGSRGRDCTCDPGVAARYAARLAGPLLDRIDLHVPLAPVDFAELTGTGRGEPSARIRARVIAARDHQAARYRGSPIPLNAVIAAGEAERFCRPDRSALALIERACAKRLLSARGVDRTLRLARTIADLAAAPECGHDHVAEAINYRRPVFE